MNETKDLVRVLRVESKEEINEYLKDIKYYDKDRELYLDFTELDIADISFVFNNISNYKKINNVCIDMGTEDDLRDEKAEALKQALITTPTITSLSIYNLTSLQAVIIADFFKINTTLTHLFIPINRMIDDKGFIEIVKALGANSNITELNFSEDLSTGNSVNESPPISNIGAETLANLISKNSSITTLILNNTFSNADSHLNNIPIICKGLESNNSIKTIDLNCNDINDEGAAALAKVLQSSSAVIADLKIAANSIKDEGAIVLANALRVNTTLVKIDMNANLIGDEGAIALAKALESHISIRDIDLMDNPVSIKAMQAALNTLAKNQFITTFGIVNDDQGEDNEDPAAEEVNIAICKSVNSNRKLVKELADFIYNKFNADMSGSNDALLAVNEYHNLLSYQRCDKELLHKYLVELYRNNEEDKELHESPSKKPKIVITDPLTGAQYKLDNYKDQIPKSDYSKYQTTVEKTCSKVNEYINTNYAYIKGIFRSNNQEIWGHSPITSKIFGFLGKNSLSHVKLQSQQGDNENNDNFEVNASDISSVDKHNMDTNLLGDLPDVDLG